MANTYTQIHIHAVFAVQNRLSWIHKDWKEELYKSQLPRVIRYIKNQEKHHSRKTFTEEYLEILDKFNVDFDKRYIFKEVL